jgi:hypothetical protein
VRIGALRFGCRYGIGYCIGYGIALFDMTARHQMQSVCNLKQIDPLSNVKISFQEYDDDASTISL